MAAPYKQCKVASDGSTNNSETMQCADLRIGEVICEFVSYNIPSFWLFSLNVLISFFLFRDSENDLLGKAYILSILVPRSLRFFQPEGHSHEKKKGS